MGQVCLLSPLFRRFSPGERGSAQSCSWSHLTSVPGCGTGSSKGREGVSPSSSSDGRGASRLPLLDGTRRSTPYRAPLASLQHHQIWTGFNWPGKSHFPDWNAPSAYLKQEGYLNPWRRSYLILFSHCFTVSFFPGFYRGNHWTVLADVRKKSPEAHIQHGKFQPER